MQSSSRPRARSTRAASVLIAGTLLACAPTAPRDRASVSAALTARGAPGLRDDPREGLRLPPGIDLARPLTEDDAVAIALWNNGLFQADLATLGVARADLLDAGMIKNPLLTLFLPMGPRQLEFTATLPVEALWQRPRRIAAARLEVERVAEALVQHGLDLVRDTKLAHSNLLAASEREALVRSSAELRGRLAQMAEARLRAGDISALEASTAQIDARSAQEEVVHASRRTQLARAVLRGRLGLGGARDPSGASLHQDDRLVAAAAAPEPRQVDDAAAAIKQALALRPDLRAAELAIEAAGARLGWEKTKIVPNLAATAKGSGVGGEFVVGPGFALEIPLFNQNQGPRARAAAEIERAIWLYAATRQRIVEDVETAQVQYLEARDALAVLRAGILAAVDENVRRAEKAYQGGDAPYLVVLEASRQFLDARLREADAVAALRRAGAELDRSIGRKLVTPN